MNKKFNIPFGGTFFRVLKSFKIGNTKFNSENILAFFTGRETSSATLEIFKFNKIAENFDEIEYNDKFKDIKFFQNNVRNKIFLTQISRGNI